MFGCKAYERRGKGKLGKREGERERDRDDRRKTTLPQPPSLILRSGSMSSSNYSIVELRTVSSLLANIQGRNPSSRVNKLLIYNKQFNTLGTWRYTHNWGGTRNIFCATWPLNKSFCWFHRRNTKMHYFLTNIYTRSYSSVTYKQGYTGTWPVTHHYRFACKGGWKLLTWATGSLHTRTLTARHRIRSLTGVQGTWRA